MIRVEQGLAELAPVEVLPLALRRTPHLMKKPGVGALRNAGIRGVHRVATCPG